MEICVVPDIFHSVIYSMDQTPSREVNGSSVCQGVPRKYTESGTSFPQAQGPTTCPYPEPARTGPYPYIPLPLEPS